MEQTLGKRIMQNRKRLGLTQEQLAEKMNVSAQAVSKWENDQTCPDIAAVPRLAEIFGITTDELLGVQEPVHQGEVVSDRREEEAQDGVHFSNNRFEFHWDGGKKTAVSWAVFVILFGAAYLAAQLLQLDVNFWQMLWPCGVIWISLLGLMHKFSFLCVGGILLGSWFLADRFFDLQPLKGGVVWAILILIFGLGLLADALRKNRKESMTFTYTDPTGRKHRGKRESSMSMEDTSFSYEASFGQERRKVEMELLKEGSVETNFGAYTLDLTGVQQVSENCHICAECNFGELTILVPERFSVRSSTDTSFAGYSVKGIPSLQPEGIIQLDVEVNFGQTEVKYV